MCSTLPSFSPNISQVLPTAAGCYLRGWSLGTRLLIIREGPRTGSSPKRSLPLTRPSIWSLPRGPAVPATIRLVKALPGLGRVITVVLVVPAVFFCVVRGLTFGAGKGWR
jgi:hypothetical protein